MFKKLSDKFPTTWPGWLPRWPRRVNGGPGDEPEFEPYEPYAPYQDEPWQHLVDHLDWDQPEAAVHLETMARIVVLGLPDSGKSTLLNAWCGWAVSPTQAEAAPVEDFGLFCLVDVPPVAPVDPAISFYPDGQFDSIEQVEFDRAPRHDPYRGGSDQTEPLILAEGADLVLYLIDCQAGVQPADFRWVGRLRQSGVPLLVILTKCDLLTGNPTAYKAEVENRLATPVRPISTRHNATELDDLLTEMMKISPKLTVALGRAFVRLRFKAVQRLTRQAAWLNGLVSLQPIPLVDIPIQLSTIKDLVLKIAALYDRPLSEVQRREAMTAMVGGLAGRYAAQQVAKLVPVAGWLVSGVLGWSYTWLFGHAAATYFAANGDQVLRRRVGQVQQRAGQTAHSVQRAWQRRPRLKIEWPDRD